MAFGLEINLFLCNSLLGGCAFELPLNSLRTFHPLLGWPNLFFKKIVFASSIFLLRVFFSCLYRRQSS